MDRIAVFLTNPPERRALTRAQRILDRESGELETAAADGRSAVVLELGGVDHDEVGQALVRLESELGEAVWFAEVVDDDDAEEVGEDDAGIEPLTPEQLRSLVHLIDDQDDDDDVSELDDDLDDDL